MGIVITYRPFKQLFLIRAHLHGVMGEKPQNSFVSIVFYCISIVLLTKTVILLSRYALHGVKT